jgi:hypothetical protein
MIAKVAASDHSATRERVGAAIGVKRMLLGDR